MSKFKELCALIEEAAISAIEKELSFQEKKRLWEVCEHAMDELEKLTEETSIAGRLRPPNDTSYYGEKLSGLRSCVAALLDEYPFEDRASVKKMAPQNYGGYLNILSNAETREE